MDQLSWHALVLPTELLWYEPYLTKLTWHEPTNINWLEPVLTKITCPKPRPAKLDRYKPYLLEFSVREDLEQAIQRFEEAVVPTDTLEAALLGEATEAIKLGDAFKLGLCLDRLRDRPSWLIDQIAQLLLDLHPLGRRLEFRPVNPKDPDETPIREFMLGLEVEAHGGTLQKAIDAMKIPRRTIERAQARLRQWRQDAKYLRRKP